jgi:hypothetical protein
LGGEAKEPDATPESKEEETVIDFTLGVQPYELWNVDVKYKSYQDEDFRVHRTAEFTKKGDKPVRVTHIEQRHAETLNAQSENSKQRLYLKK